MKTYEQAIADAAAAFNDFLAEEGRQLATVAALPQPEQQEAPRRRQRPRKAA
ncbi:hypothetical protein ACFFX1_54610 [Dactylosporangium sucinum]|uniref:hypothetical protein n=1 Tax=Dactylosporangium sucinum TaxID=1424081 RepID=UPI00167EAD66|nr:hypothetical protein [Dactylosporangium sucinum]